MSDPGQRLKDRSAVHLSIIVPAYNAEKSLPALIKALAAQTYRDFEVIMVDDGSTDATARLIAESGYILVRTDGNRGPAYARNRGATAARGNVLAFTDADCAPARDWAVRIATRMSDGNCDAIMGRLILEHSDPLGNAISALGFPAGGSVGFEKIWKVDADGFTSSLSTCNCAVKKEVFFQAGGFDESFPYPGGEDTLLARNLVRQGYRIKFCPATVVYHAARNDLRDFFKWQYKRGISSYIFSKKVKQKSSFLAMRLWSSANVLKAAVHNNRLGTVATLLVIGYGTQFAGYLLARYDRKIYESINH